MLLLLFILLWLFFEIVSFFFLVIFMFCFGLSCKRPQSVFSKLLWEFVRLLFYFISKCSLLIRSISRRVLYACCVYNIRTKHCLIIFSLCVLFFSFTLRPRIARCARTRAHIQIHTSTLAATPYKDTLFYPMWNDEEEGEKNQFWLFYSAFLIALCNGHKLQERKIHYNRSNKMVYNHQRSCEKRQWTHSFIG